MMSLFAKVLSSTSGRRLKNKQTVFNQATSLLLAAFASSTVASVMVGGPQAAVYAQNGHEKVVYQQWTDSKTGRTLPIKIYMPLSGKAPYPVVIFSHGLGGSVEAAPYLADAWTKAGYICFFIQHPGSDNGLWKPVMMQGKQAILSAMKEGANAKSLLERVGDASFVIDQLIERNKQDNLLKGQLDTSKIAMSGHSFGAGTTLALAGETYPNGKCMPDARVKAAIYLCPPVNINRISAETYAKIKIPAMLFTGTLDTSAIHETQATDRRKPFDGTTAPHQYLVIFDGANHATFGGGRGPGGRNLRGTANDPQYQAMTALLATKFLDAYLKGDAAAEKWLDSAAATDYLGKMAHFERK